MLLVIFATLILSPCHAGVISGVDDISHLQTNVAVHAVRKETKSAPACDGYTDPSLLDFFPGNAKLPWPGPYHNGNRLEMPREKVSDLSYERFFQDYVVPNKPVIIEGATENTFKDASNGWTPTSLVQAPFSDLLQPVNKDGGRLADEGEVYQSIPQIFADRDKGVLFNKSSFGELMAVSAESLPLSNLLFQKQFLLRLKNHSFLNLNGSQFDSLNGYFNLHVSNQGGALPHSHESTLNLLFHGSKRWIMFDPMEYPNADARYAFEKMDVWGEGTIDEYSQKWFAQEAKAALDTLEIPYYDFALNVGEAVYIPDWWMHATEDLCRETVGVELRGSLVIGGYRPCWLQGLHLRDTSPDFKFGYPHVECEPH